MCTRWGLREIMRRQNLLLNRGLGHEAGLTKDVIVDDVAEAAEVVEVVKVFEAKILLAILNELET